MSQIPANIGWSWVKQGFQYFKRQPLEFSTLFLGYLFFMLVLGFIPFVGQLIAFVLLPLFTLSFMQGCREIDQGLRVHPKLLLYGFQSPAAAKLIQLGVLYLLAAIIALSVSTFIDGGIFWQVISGQMELTAKNIEDTNMTAAMMFSMIIYIPAMMAFWFAGPLIAWQQMPLFKAVFYSFVTTFRSLRAFLVYALAWFVAGGLIPTVFSIIIAAITGNPNAIVLIMMPLSMVLTIVLYCSFYPTYKSIFDQSASVTGEESSTIS